ncbi:MAG: replication-associated recombination protein A [Planctomycetota bacterium]
MSETGSLFDDHVDPDESPAAGDGAPLAERMRPRRLEDYLGQEEVLGPGSALRDLIEGDRLSSMILWGPPGCGKTTLARILAGRTGLEFIAFSAVLSGVREVRAVVAEARARRRVSGRGTLLFVDEIHRFNKAQQDAFLPHVEDGTIVLVGATTENPSFELNPALLSRSRVVVLRALDRDSLLAIARGALEDRERSGLPTGIALDDEALEVVVDGAGGDARAMFNRLEALVLREASRGGLGRSRIDAARARESLADPRLRYDKSGEEHFNVMSAFHKSLRGGDVQAGLYWLARMLEGGEDRAWVARRLVRFASEDVGLADPQALPLALAASAAWERLGSPEGELALAQAAAYLATAPKSNAIYRAFDAAREAVRSGELHDVPMHLRNASTGLMRSLGYGRDYRYPHDFDEAIADQGYLPAALADARFYEPSPFGHEKEIARRMSWWDEVRERLRGGKRDGTLRDPRAGERGEEGKP